MTFTMIPFVDARDFPDDVEEYCAEKDISTHCDNDCVYIENDDNPFAQWLRKIGYEFQSEDGDNVAIAGS